MERMKKYMEVTIQRVSYGFGKGGGNRTHNHRVKVCCLTV